MLRVVVASVLVLAGCGNDLPAPTDGADLSAAVPRDMVASSACPDTPLQAGACRGDAVCSFATDAAPFERCFCLPWGGGTWSCGNCRFWPEAQLAEGRAFDVPQCGASDNGCTQRWGEDFYTCVCRPDGSGRCCPDTAGPTCFSVDGG